MGRIHPDFLYIDKEGELLAWMCLVANSWLWGVFIANGTPTLYISCAPLSTRANGILSRYFSGSN